MPFEFPILDKLGILSQKENQKDIQYTPNTRLYSLSANPENEREIYKNHLQKSEKTYIVLLTPKVAQDTLQIIKDIGFSGTFGLHFEKFCSLSEIANMLHNEVKWSRKMTIFLGKILIWLNTTETGLLDELKFY